MLLSPPIVSLGINCRGSFYCTGMDKRNVTGRMVDLTTIIPSRAIYGSGAHIACQGTKELLTGHVGAFCLFMQGSNAHGITNPITGDRLISIDGALIKRKTLELYQHGCRACGSVPVSDNNDPDEQGILTLNYVTNAAGCNGVRACDPTIAAGDHAHNPLETGQDVVYSVPNTANPTSNDTEPCVPSPRRAGSVAAVAQVVPPSPLVEDCDGFGQPSPISPSAVLDEDAAIVKAIASVRSEEDLGVSPITSTANATAVAVAVAVNATSSISVMQSPTALLIKTSESDMQAQKTFSTIAVSQISNKPVGSGRAFTGGH